MDFLLNENVENIGSADESFILEKQFIKDGDTRYYKVTFSEETVGKFQIRCADEYSSPDLTVYDSDGNDIGDSSGFFCAGDYYIGVSGSDADFLLCFENARDLGNLTDSLSADRLHPFYIQDTDFFKFSIDESSVVQIGTRFEYSVYDANGEEIFDLSEPLEAGSYFVKVS